ncbi:redox-sensing transcriptional repressor Rex [Treponema sp. OttesenSCG-928-L16]|nr:redox-sensing transcriptional repressor Rex [Treponema sp. OttesenSCG-928-L16]
MSAESVVPLAVFNRLPLYLRSLQAMRAEGIATISSVALAEAVALNPSVVKKDLSFVIVNVGKPKVGYVINDLIEDIEEFLGYNNTKDAVLVGMGKLGQALMGYHGFEKYGLNIIGGFDVDEAIFNKKINGKKIMPLDKMASAVKKLQIKIAILTLPQEHAQEVTDLLVQAGIQAIWNFTPAHIKAPDNVVIKNEDLAASMALLSLQLRQVLQNERN